MAKGGARLGAGRPRKPLQDHWIRGTYRKSRHGELPKHVHRLPAASPDDWQPTEADLKGWGVRAASLCQSCWRGSGDSRG